MADIKCPRIGADGHNQPHNPCAMCHGLGTIPDRRAPSAAERAVERIKQMTDNRDSGYNTALKLVRGIINEEASRDH